METNNNTDSVEAAGASSPAITANGRRTLALDVLRWLELQYLRLEFRAVKRHRLSFDDAWWMAFGGEAHSPRRFRDILRMVLDGASPAAIVHHSRINEDPVPWQTIQYRAWWSDPSTAKMWTIAFWLVWAVLGWFLICLVTPHAGQTAAQLVYWVLVVGIVVKRRAVAKRLAAFFPPLASRLSPLVQADSSGN